MKKHLHYLLFISILFVIMWEGCKLNDEIDQLSNPNWKPDFAIPLLSSKITIDDVLGQFADDSLIILGPGQPVTLIYRGRVFSTEEDKPVFNIPTPSINLPAVTLPNLDFALSMGAVAIAIGDPEKTQFFNAHGTTSNLPGIPPQSIGPYSMGGASSASDFVFESGRLELTIQNNYPIDLTNLAIDLVDLNTSTTIATYNFTVIPTGSSRTKSSDVSGKTISSNLELSIPSISSLPTLVPVPIDTSDKMNISFAGVDMVFELARDTVRIQFTEGERLDHLKLKSGSLDYSGSSTLGPGIRANLIIPTATLDGNTFDKKFSLNATRNFDLSNYEIDFTSGGTGANTFIGIVKLDGVGATLPFTSGLTYSANLSMNNLIPVFADGYLGMQLFSVDADTINLSLYANWNSGRIQFENPRILVIINNSYGFPITAKFKEFEGFNRRLDPDTLDIITPFDSITFNYPTIPGMSATTVRILDKNTTNILPVLDMPPSEVRYWIDAIANTAGDTTVTNFITDTSHFSVDVEIELPLEGTIAGFSVRDTFVIDGSLFETADYVNFAIVTDNGFPIGVDMQIYFLDENDIVLDSLLPRAKVLFTAGTIDGTGAVISPTKRVTYIPYPEKRFDGIRGTERIIVVAVFQSAEGGATTVRIYGDDFISIKLGVETRFNPDF